MNEKIKDSTMVLKNRIIFVAYICHYIVLFMFQDILRKEDAAWVLKGRAVSFYHESIRADG